MKNQLSWRYILKCIDTTINLKSQLAYSGQLTLLRDQDLLNLIIIKHTFKIGRSLFLWFMTMRVWDASVSCFLKYQGWSQFLEFFKFEPNAFFDMINFKEMVRRITLQKKFQRMILSACTRNRSKSKESFHTKINKA